MSDLPGERDGNQNKSVIESKEKVYSQEIWNGMLILSEKLRIFRVLKLEFRDFLRFNRACRYIASRTIKSLEKLKSPVKADDFSLSASRLAKAARICPSSGLRDKIEIEMLKRTAGLDTSTLNWDIVFPESKPRKIQKGIILKRPQSEREKGVLFVSFEGQWLRLFRHADIGKLARDYFLILAPTWSPPHDLPFLLAAKEWPGGLFHILSNLEDIPAFQRIAPNAVTIPLQSSNWVNADLFKPDNTTEKRFDIVMLANFAAYKRHFLLFKALRNMPSSTRVVLLGRRMDGRTADTVTSEAAFYGVENRITLLAGLPDEKLVEALRSAKISLILSGNEGSCVAVVESMFADVPVGVFADAIIGSKVYINNDTGRLLIKKDLAAQLTEFIHEYDRYCPRKWVLENDVSCIGSTGIMNSIIKAKALEWGEDWTTDIAVHHWRPNPKYLHETDAINMRDAYADFAANYGIPILQ